MNALDEQRVREIIQGGESELVAFKAALPEPAALAKEIAALANTAGGIMLVGVQDTGSVVGADVRQAAEMVELSRRSLSPAVEVDVQQALVDGKAVAAVLVQPSEELVFSNGQALGRCLSAIEPLSAAQISSKLVSARGTISMENLAEAIVKQSLIIEGLRDELREAGRFRNKLKEYVIGGVVGAVIAYLFSPILPKW